MDESQACSLVAMFWGFGAGSVGRCEVLFRPLGTALVLRRILALVNSKLSRVSNCWRFAALEIDDCFEYCERIAEDFAIEETDRSVSVLGKVAVANPVHLPAFRRRVMPAVCFHYHLVRRVGEVGMETGDACLKHIAFARQRMIVECGAEDDLGISARVDEKSSTLLIDGSA